MPTTPQAPYRMLTKGFDNYQGILRPGTTVMLHPEEVGQHHALIEGYEYPVEHHPAIQRVYPDWTPGDPPPPPPPPEERPVPRLFDPGTPGAEPVKLSELVEGEGEDVALTEPEEIHTADYDTLAKRAEELGIKVDGRWGEDRLREEILKAEEHPVED